jgi:hypothetical protein
VKRLDLGGIRTCRRCGRCTVELRAGDAVVLLVPVDPVRVPVLSGGSTDVRSLAEVTLEKLASGGLSPREVVLDAQDGHLAGFVSLGDGPEPEVVGCTAGEALTLVVAGKLPLYATDEALAYGAARSGRAHRHGSGGRDTVH